MVAGFKRALWEPVKPAGGNPFYWAKSTPSHPSVRWNYILLEFGPRLLLGFVGGGRPELADGLHHGLDRRRVVSEAGSTDGIIKSLSPWYHTRRQIDRRFSSARASEMARSMSRVNRDYLLI
jgi:hypothetical protein